VGRIYGFGRNTLKRTSSNNREDSKVDFLRELMVFSKRRILPLLTIPTNSKCIITCSATIS
jgi:hypothetical protein